MEQLEPKHLKNLQDVARYWQQCLDDAIGKDDKTVASHMVGVVSNESDIGWAEGKDASPIYNTIFELAASLETSDGTTVQRQAQWDAIRALLPVLKKYAK